MFHELNRTGIEMKMKEMREYALQSNLASRSKKNHKIKDLGRLFRSKKAS